MILIDTNYCNELYSISKTIRIADNVVAKISTPALGCAPYLAQFNNASLGGTSFIWNFGDNSPDDFSETPPPHLYPNVGTYKITLIANDSTTCNKSDTTYFTINVNSKPSAFYNYSPQPTEPNTAVNFINTSLGGVSYKWDFGDGYFLTTSKIDTTVKHIYPATDTYNTCLITTNASGCSDTTCKPISVIINPQVDLPNAFTPNGDGTNDRIYVRGYGIVQMIWRIYDRWGNQVYASEDQYAGWDGKFNGKLLAQDVYHYTLQVVFSSKEKFVKKGDITLLR
jgi:gliding motility-associated-like protein